MSDELWIKCKVHKNVNKAKTLWIGHTRTLNGLFVLIEKNKLYMCILHQDSIMT